MMRGFSLGLLFALAISPAAAQSATDAASFPNRPVRIIVPFPAGGPTDINARVIAQKMSEVWGQPVVIDLQFLERPRTRLSADPMSRST